MWKTNGSQDHFILLVLQNISRNRSHLPRLTSGCERPKAIYKLVQNPVVHQSSAVLHPVIDLRIIEMAKQQKMVVVAQRITSASLLVDNVDEWVTVGHGLIVYVSFYAGCEVSHLPGIAKRILGAPLAVSAASVEDWDGRAGTAGGAAMSVVAAGIAGGDGNPSHVLVVPQACLVSKLKGTATKPKLQYHGAKRPAEAEALYDAFVAALRGEAAAIAAKAGGGEDTVVIKCGTFGNRQALKLECPGPFSHTLQF